MKNLITILSAVIFIILFMPRAMADFSYSTKIDEVISKKSVTITYPETGEKYLLYLKTGCGVLQKGQTVNLIVKGSLDDANDILKEDTIHQCGIQRADLFTQKLYVQEVFGDNTKAYVKDSDGNLYYISYGTNCKTSGSYTNSYIYALVADNALSQSDRIIIPDNGGSCQISYAETVTPSPDKTVKTAKDKVPTAVTGVKAIPRNGSVSLVWSPAKDDKGISHYIVAYSKYPLDTKDMEPGDMEDQVTSKSTNVSVKGLENDKLYYFYVIAVDTGGNTSSDWSDPAKTTPKSSILDDSVKGKVTMNIRLSLQNKTSYLIRWTPIQGSRQTIIFEINGKRDFVKTDYAGNRVTITKRADMVGKKLTIRVRSYNIYGGVKEEKMDF